MSEDRPMSNPDLSAHEAALVAFGKFMVNADPHDPRSVDYATMGRLAAEVINGIPAVRAALTAPPAATEPPPREHEPGDPHVYRTLCEVCGIPGQLYIALVPERDQPAPPLTFGEQIADESPLGRRIAGDKAEAPR